VAAKAKYHLPNKDAGQKRLSEILNTHPIDDVQSAIKFVEEILHNLRNDTSKAPPTSSSLTKQLMQNVSLNDLYDFLYKLDYLDVRFKIQFNGKDLNENVFSPGEKGALLLIFYLLIDQARIPLIMDQPEENLDNESVFRLLVPYVKKAKENRQIIIVTHNPNLAVVCDAEQIIFAQMDKGKSEIRYQSGSIESPVMNKKIVDTLEGTMPAFTKRDEKYIRT
jgi:wobble nucleotide-excising tRNase